MSDQDAAKLAREAVDATALHLVKSTYHVTTEAELQDAVEEVLVERFGPGLVRREVRRGADRFDFTVLHPAAGLIVVELKVGGSQQDALRQCSRYLDGYADVVGLVCASKRVTVVTRWPFELAGKPTRGVVLRSWP